MVKDNGSKNTLAASTKDTWCFARFASAFLGSHSNSVAIYEASSDPSADCPAPTFLKSVSESAYQSTAPPVCCSDRKQSSSEFRLCGIIHSPCVRDPGESGK